MKKNTTLANTTKPFLIVSFTSFPKRIHLVPRVLQSLYSQTLQPDKILLYLAEEQFPNKEADLPDELLKDAKAGKFELRWCDDLGSHKKYFYAMQEFPNDIFILVDDDCIYHPDTIKSLYELHLENPTCIVTFITKMIMFDQNGKVKPYKDWLLIPTPSFPSMRLIGMGGNGILYPPHSLSQNVFDKKAILEHCNYKGVICGDDLWLKMHSILVGTKTVTSKNTTYHEPEIIDSSNTIIGNLSYDQLQHEQVLRFLLNKHGVNDTKTVEDILMEQEMEYQNSGICPEQEYINYSYADDVGSVLVNKLEKRKNNSNKGQDHDKHPLTKGFLIYLLRFANGAIARAGSPSSEKLLGDLREAFLSIPNITELSKNSFDIRAFLKHGELIMTKLAPSDSWESRFGHTIDYLQVLENWKTFFANNPDYRTKYKEKYMHFLLSIKKVVSKKSKKGFFLDEVAQLEKAFKENWKNVPVKDKTEVMLKDICNYVKKIISKKTDKKSNK